MIELSESEHACYAGTKSCQLGKQEEIIRWEEKRCAYKVPMPNMKHTTTRCAFGICSLQIVGSGRKQSNRSVAMFTPAEV
jgi:hypothetical protein